MDDEPEDFCLDCGSPVPCNVDHSVDDDPAGDLRADFQHALKLLRAATRWLEPGTCKIEIDEFLSVHPIKD